MKILITNSTVAKPGGAECFVRDLGQALAGRGHEVAAYITTPVSGRSSAAGETLPIFHDLDALPFRPDVIHAQHHLDAMAVIIGLPGVPAVYHCHGAVWRESLPLHPRILHYLAMSRTLAERMIIESNLDPRTVTHWYNTVDTVRFKKVRLPGAKIAKALFYNKIHGPDSPTYRAISEATAALGIDLAAVGKYFGNPIVPESTLPEYDLVFASGKSAIDALASGCAVIVLGRTGCGELVTTDNYDRLRQVNFSIAVNSPAPGVNEVRDQLLRYDPGDCATITYWIRRDADLLARVDGLLEIYQRVVEMNRHRLPDDAEEVRAQARYLRWITPLIRSTDLVLDTVAD